MNKRVYTMITFAMLVSFLLMSIIPDSAISANSDSPQLIVGQKEDWTITFNDAVLDDDTNLNKISVQSAKGESVDHSISLSTDLEKIIVKPKNPYLFGNTYTLVIPEGFESEKGVKTSTEVRHTFKITGNYIESIKAIYNPLVTNIIVNSDDATIRVVVTLENGEEVDLDGKYKPKFSRGVRGLLPGDLLKIEAYDANNRLLETQYVEVQE